MQEKITRELILTDRYFIDNINSDGESLEVHLTKDGKNITLSFSLIIMFTMLDESYMADYFNQAALQGTFIDHSLFLVSNSRRIRRIKKRSPEYESVNMTNYLVFDGMRFIDIVITGDMETIMKD